MSGHSSKCYCGVCTCGRHRCGKPARNVDPHMDSETEYSRHYLKHTCGRPEKGHPNQQQLSIGGGEFYGQTENKDKFPVHQVKKIQTHQPPVYVPNTNRFDGATTQRRDFTKWDVQPPKKKEAAKYQPSADRFDGRTTNTTDYMAHPLQARYHHETQKYVKNPNKFEGMSVKAHDYQPWSGNHAAISAQKKQSYLPENESRDFMSTVQASYKGEATSKTQSMAPKRVYNVNPNKFEGVSTNHADFNSKELPEKYIRAKQVYQPSPDHFDGTTTYKNNYNEKSCDRFIRKVEPHRVPNLKFDGQTTHQHDFGKYGHIDKVTNYAPHRQYVQECDNRDFVSSNRGDYTPKYIPRCPALDWVGMEREQMPDGHQYLKECKKLAVAEV